MRPTEKSAPQRNLGPHLFPLALAAPPRPPAPSREPPDAPNRCPASRRQNEQRYQAHVPAMGLLRQGSTPTSICAIRAEDPEAVTTPTIHNRKRVETVEGNDIWLRVLDLYFSYWSCMFELSWTGLCMFMMDLRNDDRLVCSFVMEFINLRTDECYGLIVISEKIDECCGLIYTARVFCCICIL
ncbi:hypothetical protein BS78_05G144500 [Paspalum vaginatum]|nr:hypothetical protein BS78_05G144500 [Paspalum vaginatum]